MAVRAFFGRDSHETYQAHLKLNPKGGESAARAAIGLEPWEQPGVIEYLPEIAPALSCFVDASGCWRYGANGKVVLGWDYAQLESFLRLSGSQDIPALFVDLRHMERERLKLQSEQTEATKQLKLTL